MSGAAFQLASAPTAAPGNRSVLAHLLHALNQPLTGLQCSMELAVAASRTPAQYLRTLQEGLELISRMRLLVETIREVADPQQALDEEAEPFALDVLVSETAAGLAPVGESKSIRLKLECLGPLLVRQGRRRLSGLIFRLLESAIELAQQGTDIAITTSLEGKQALVVISWSNGPVHGHSPFSRPELGLLIARAGWEQAGATWTQQSIDGVQSCAVRIAVISAQPHLSEF
jgi:signal transduction histidine kinase